MPTTLVNPVSLVKPSGYAHGVLAGGQVSDVVKLTQFVTDKRAYRAQLKPIGEAYRVVFGRHYPAMTLVEVKSLFDDEALIEIEGFAVLAGEGPRGA
jgi:enamine deaminase RidA (YjgF/YER057c/UK114 family)